MSEQDELRIRSKAMWRAVMQADAPPVTDPYTEVTTDHLMGRIWTRPGLARRDRRLVTLTTAAMAAQRDSLRNHLRAALESGDLGPKELEEWIVHLAHYAGWPAATTAYSLLRELSPVSADRPGSAGASSLPIGPFTCDVSLRRIRAPRFVREERDGVTFMVARDYETAYDTILRFADGAQLPITARVVGELNERLIVRDPGGRPVRASGVVLGRVEISTADGRVIFRGRYYDSRTLQSLAGDEAMTPVGPAIVDHLENGFGEGAYAGHAFALSARMTREGDRPLRGEARGDID